MSRCLGDTPHMAKLRNNAVKGRKLIAVQMTPAQIAEAQRMAREWKPKNIEQMLRYDRNFFSFPKVQLTLV